MPTSEKITLISHVLCPYVQRAVISLTEKNIAFERIDIDLANKPDWFQKISPLGKTPVLQIGEIVIFESNVILEYLEDTLVHPLHPSDALERAQHRSLIEFGSSILADIAGLYMASNQELFADKKANIIKKLSWLESQKNNSPWYGGDEFNLVDAVYGPVFRYFDTFEILEGMRFFKGLPKLSIWRNNLSKRASIQQAVSTDYPERLRMFIIKKNSHLSKLMQAAST